MTLGRKFLVVALTGGMMTLGSSCADDNLAKGLITAGGAAGGAFVGAKLASPEHKLAGGVIGAAAGGLLGFGLGGALVKH